MEANDSDGQPQKSPIGQREKSKLQSQKRKLWLSLIGAGIICTLLIVFAPLDVNRKTYSDAISTVFSGTAFVLSLQVIHRQKLKGIIPRLYVSLGVGLGLWFVAEMIWAYYELVAAIETPFPSIADVFWLAGYIGFFYFLFGMLKNVLRVPRSVFLPLTLLSSIGVLLIVNVLFSIYQSADLTSKDGILTYLVSSAYPVADMLLIVPLVGVFIQLRKGRLTGTPWAHLVTATVIFIIADVGFAYFIVTKAMEEMLWVWDPLYAVGYLAVACSLFWHKEFFTTDEKKLIREWQEKNR